MSADVKWIKISTDIFNNKKIKQIKKMPDGDTLIVIWLQMLCLSAKCNANGKLYLVSNMPYSEQMLSYEFDFPKEIIHSAISIFEKYTMITVNDEIITINNWSDYYDDKEEARRTRERIKKYNQRHRIINSLNTEKKCAYCGKSADTVDHIIPLAKGGNNELDNLVAACQSCNSRKKDRDLADFLNCYLDNNILNYDFIVSNDKLMKNVSFDYEKKRFIQK